MSYGWLTESSLQPKPGKPIDLSASSLHNLRAVIYKREEEAKRLREERGGSSWVKPTKKICTQQERLMRCKNAAVEERSKKDEAFNAAQKTDYDLVTKKLIEKSKVYDARIAAAARAEGDESSDTDAEGEGHRDANVSSNGDDAASTKRRLLRASLVDFELKVSVPREANNTSATTSSNIRLTEECSDNVDDRSPHMTDEGGAPNEAKRVVVAVGVPQDDHSTNSEEEKRRLAAVESKLFLEKIEAHTARVRETRQGAAKSEKEALRAELRGLRAASRKTKTQ